MSDNKKNADFIRDKRIICGVRVLVVASHATIPSDKKRKAEIIGYTGIITHIYKDQEDSVPYTIDFDNVIMKAKGNGYYWRATEIIYLEDQNYVK